MKRERITNKRFKKTILIMIVATTLLVSVVVLLDMTIMTKSEAFKYVVSNQEELLAFVSAASSNNDQPQRYKMFRVSSWNNATMVQFETQSIGLGSGSTYKGFYYINNDKPVGFQGTSVAFLERDPGWYWTDDTDNWMYVERILPNWYWFEAHF